MGLTIVGVLAFSGAMAQAGGHWGIGVNIGFPGY